MRIAVRIALVGLGLLATGMNVLGQTADTPQTTPQNQQKNQNTDEITAVPNRPTFASTAEMVQLGVFEIEYGFEAGKGHQNVNGPLRSGEHTSELQSRLHFLCRLLLAKKKKTT